MWTETGNIHLANLPKKSEIKFRIQDEQTKYLVAILMACQFTKFGVKKGLT